MCRSLNSLFSLIVLLIFIFPFSSICSTGLQVFDGNDEFSIASSDYSDEDLPTEQEWECVGHPDLHHSRNTKNHAFDQFVPLLSAECEPLSTVAGCVNVRSGYFFQVNTDIKGTTIDPLDFVIHYDSCSSSESFLGYGFGSGFPLWASSVEKGARHHYGLISESENFLLLYRNKEHGNTKSCGVDPRVLENGYTNLCRPDVSGKTNFVNYRATFSKNGKPHWKVRLGDGSSRIYSKQVSLDKEKRKLLNLQSKSAYLLTHATKANGNHLRFHYNDVNGTLLLKKISTFDRNEKHILNELHFDYQDGLCTISDGCGNSAHYHQEIETRPHRTTLFFDYFTRNFLKSISTTQHKERAFTTDKLSWSVTKITRPDGRYLKVNYYDGGKVKSLMGPQDSQDDTLLYRFTYEKDSTTVIDAAHQKTIYHYDNHQRIAKIRYLNGKGNSIRRDAFLWSSIGETTGWLAAKSIGLRDQLHYLKTYDYDRRGNVIKETLYGNLTGEKPPSFDFKQRETTDKWPIFYSYYHDDRNLMKEKSTSDGLVVSYSYLEGTNLCTKTLTQYDGKIQERKFCTYDDLGELSIIIEDDGSSRDENSLQDVTLRRIRRINPINEKGAAFGKPQKISEYYLDRQTGGEVFLKEIHLSYDGRGCERERKTIDSRNNCIVTSKVYNECLQIIEETNPLGHITRYAYDNNDNKIFEELIGSGKQTHYTFDFANRLKEKREVHDNGQLFITAYQYNALDQLIAETDPYGQTTTYAYDRLGNQTHCCKPSCQEGIIPTIIKEYNLLNQEISTTDENGMKTLTSYNLYGNPIKIIYPDERVEKFFYTPSGRLKEKHCANKTVITYRYDGAGHLIEETFKDSKGEVLKTNEYQYKGAHLVLQKDGMGLITRYEYDGAGRKIQEKIGDLKSIEYRYDDFDRIIEIKQDTQSETIDYDAAGRPIERRIRQSGVLVSKENLAYDIQGNKTSRTIWQNDQQAAIYSTHYFSDGSLEWREDPLLHRTSYSHDYNKQFSLGNRIAAMTTKDPLGRLTVETYDPHHRLMKREILNDGQTAACIHWTYDAAGNCIKEHTTVMSNFTPLREYWVERQYYPSGLLEKEVEMPAGKTTGFRYNSMHQLKKKVKPDGVEIHYRYDALNRLKKVYSSDNTIGYFYLYDLHDNIIQVHDLIRQISQYRQYDLYGRLEKEEAIPGIIVYYQYDSQDRLTKLTLPDGSTISYIYDSHLSKIQRYDSNQSLKYEIDCLAYDLRHNLLTVRTPAGTVQTAYDLLGRAVKIQSPHWESHLEYFDPAGNLCHMRQTDPNGTVDKKFSYDRFNHLVSESAKGNQFAYDSLGNCLSKNDKSHQIDSLNRLTSDGISDYTYDANGNLISESNPRATYAYDAWNRLIKCEREGRPTTFHYDAYGRCLQIDDSSGSRKLIYYGEQEIGSMLNGQLYEFRLVHPDADADRAFALELQGQAYFPIQDYRGNLCALQKQDGTLAEWTRYSAFGLKTQFGEGRFFNPWKFANRREVEDLSLFTHRLYHPRQMRWLTTDPLGFEEGLNLYSYTKNNPFYYKDSDGRYAFVIPLVMGAFGAGGIAISTPTLTYIGCSLLAAGAGWVAHKALQYTSTRLNDVNVDESAPVDDVDDTEGKRKRLRPHPDASGPHTTIKRDPDTGEITHYETYRPQTNPKNPNKWESVKRYDGPKTDKHWNKKLNEDVNPPHIHDPTAPGGIRPAQSWEIPLL